MPKKFVPISGSQSFFHLANKPLVVIDEAFYCLLRQQLRIASASSGNASEFSVHIGSKIYFHALSVEIAEAGCQYQCSSYADELICRHRDNAQRAIGSFPSTTF